MASSAEEAKQTKEHKAYVPVAFENGRYVSRPADQLV